MIVNCPRLEKGISEIREPSPRPSRWPERATREVVSGVRIRPGQFVDQGPPARYRKVIYEQHQPFLKFRLGIHTVVQSSNQNYLECSMHGKHTGLFILNFEYDKRLSTVRFWERKPLQQLSFGVLNRIHVDRDLAIPRGRTPLGYFLFEPRRNR